MSDMTRPPGDDTRDVRGSARPDATGAADRDARGSAGPDARGSAVPDARGETALGTGHGSTPHGIDDPTHRTTGKGTPETSRTPVASETSPTSGTSGAHGTHLLPHDESDKLASQLHHAVAEFVDAPRAAVEEADHVLEEIAARFTEAVTQRRRTLRHSWQSVEGGQGKPVSSGDTEQLRLALKDYRELAERLLHV
ncbi:hypothetical protein [Streptomyces swartbergensis]|uniref:Uncharacterized protein n=1 Tax=Streptomyces swartbergensis TaxID=487165 RepID=A0A243S031_9ACTN|nr:hypothetical protein [Streptomyces swartbergensis]OUD00817.1 hypothetical protein CA983_23580 [Streptomyces swartbergensis]